MDKPPYDLPLPAADAGLDAAAPVALAMAGHLLLDGAAPAALTICRIGRRYPRLPSAAGIIAAIMHMEGAEAIGADLDALHVWHAAGLRSLGPVWSRPTLFGHGVPFRFPSGARYRPGADRGGQGAGRRMQRAAAS